MKNLTALFLTVSAIACGGNKSGSGAAAGRTAETDRYYKAIDASFEGDSRAGYDGLLELAADSPDTRAGRKARAVLMADDPLLYIAGIGILSATAIPAFSRFTGKTGADADDGAVVAPQGMFIAQQARAAMYDARETRGRFPKTIKETGYIPTDDDRFIVLMGKKDVVAPRSMPKAAVTALTAKAISTINAAGIKLGSSGKKFVIAVAANFDDDADIDLWTIDENDDLVHVMDDLAE